MKILFLCVANSARSQMAEGLARNLCKNSAIICSAGSQPSFVHPLAIKVMQELGIDITAQTSKSVDTIDLDSVDRVITLCADEVCPHVATTVVKEHWPLPDPADKNQSESMQLAQFRQVRDDLAQRIKILCEAIVADKNIKS